MRSIILLSSAILFLIVGSMSVTAQTNDDIAVTVGEKGCSKTASIGVEFIRVVEDSRCPEGVDCIWAGRSVIEVRAAKDGASSDIVTLSSEGGEKSMEFGGYRLVFEKLEPYPKEGEAIDNAKYKAWFKFEKL